MKTLTHRTHSQRGFTLAEILVAMAIFALIIVASLFLYDRSNQIFKTSTESADMQQNVRVGFEKMVSEVRMAGYDYNRDGRPMGGAATRWIPNQAYGIGAMVTPTVPNGHFYRATAQGTSGVAPGPDFPLDAGDTVSEGVGRPTWKESGGVESEQPDEQIEYAGPAAITIRGNYDAEAGETGDIDNGREPNLESGQFRVVTTGNSEIVTYALVSNDATKNTGDPTANSVSFFADVNASGAPTRTAYPGGSPSVEREVVIDGVDLTNNNPPYTLFRFTLNDDGSVNRQPLAENIRSLRLQYFEDTAGTRPLTDLAGAVTTGPLGAGQFNPAVVGTVAGRTIRSKIQSINVDLVGMNAQRDSKYQDITDTVAPNFRKVALSSLVAPRNIGREGSREVTGNPPPAPTIDSVCVGYCGVAVVTWTPGSGSEDATYAVMYDTSPTGSFGNIFDAGLSTQYAAELIPPRGNPSVDYYFRVRATNVAGSTLSTNTVQVSIKNATKPNAPSTLMASGNGGAGAPAAKPNAVDVTWSAPTTNASGSITCTGAGVAPYQNVSAEIAGFRIFRSTDPAFDPAGMTPLVDENAIGANRPIGDGAGNYIWTDTIVGNCIDYHYRIQTVEHCAANDDYNNPAGVATATSVIFPAFGTNGIMGKAQTAAQPLPPTLLSIDMASPDTVCTGAPATCSVAMAFRKTETDTASPSNPLLIDQYIVTRQQRLNGVPVGLPVDQTITNALAVSTATIPFVDRSSIPQTDTVTGIRFTYTYSVKAHQPTPCLDSAPSVEAIYPAPCAFTGSIILETGAVSGDGLTAGSAWVMNAGDGLEVLGGGTTLTNVVMDVYLGASLVGTFTDGSSLFQFGWSDRIDGAKYRLVFTISDNSAPPCVEQLERWVEDETPPGCDLDDDDPNGTIFAVTGSSSTSFPQFSLRLNNVGGEALNLEELVITWTKPSRVDWRSVDFPSGNLQQCPGLAQCNGSPTPSTGNSFATGTRTFTLNPRPTPLIASDVIVPASGSSLLNFNFVKTGNGSGSTVALSNISKICVRYRRVSTGTTVFSCRIHNSTAPDSSVNNPTTCD